MSIAVAWCFQARQWRLIGSCRESTGEGSANFCSVKSVDRLNGLIMYTEDHNAIRAHGTTDCEVCLPCELENGRPKRSVFESSGKPANISPINRTAVVAIHGYLSAKSKENVCHGSVVESAADWLLESLPE